MYDIITIPIIFQLTQELDSLCSQIPIYELRLFYVCLRCIFFYVYSDVYQLISILVRANIRKTKTLNEPLDLGEFLS